jgi:hypothetical protein
VCSDAGHLLAEIGDQVRVCQAAESEWTIAHASAKACKETWDEEKATLLKLVRESTAPTPLPLFDQTGAAADAPPAAAPRRRDDEPIAAFYFDGVGVKRCSVCMHEWPCNVDHSQDPPAEPPRAPEWPPNQPGSGA